jgi:Na+-translocating ferredoxin:NAD+ oxidoreductase RnfG subunit
MRRLRKSTFLRRAGIRVLAALIWLAAGGPVGAEKFLTVEQAQSIMLPGADRFEAMTVMFSPEQKKAIETASRLKVRNRGNRVFRGYEKSRLIGVIMVDHVIGKHELIDYAVALNPRGEILSVEILEYRESHGGEITRKDWRGQFPGKSARDPLKLHGDIYNISGATISCRNVTEGVRRILATYEEVVRPRLLATGELPFSIR